jgi:hypothetical protein
MSFWPIVGSLALIVGFRAALIVVAARGLYVLAYTFIYIHVIDIYLFKLLYTCVNLVYSVIYAFIQCI